LENSSAGLGNYIISGGFWEIPKKILPLIILSPTSGKKLKEKK